MNKKIALAPCNGMSANGLISRVAVGDAKAENQSLISVCMGSTSADISGQNNKMLKKYPLIAINGCGNNCVNTILENKGVPIKNTINVGEVLSKHDLKANDSYRLDAAGEKCVKKIKDVIKWNVDAVVKEK